MSPSNYFFFLYLICQSGTIVRRAGLSSLAHSYVTFLRADGQYKDRLIGQQTNGRLDRHGGFCVAVIVIVVYLAVVR